MNRKGKTRSIVSLALSLALLLSTSPLLDSALILKAQSVCSLTEAGTIVDNIQGGMATQINGANSVFVVGNIAYVTGGENDGLSTFDISNPASIIERDTLVSGGSVDLDEANSVFVVGTTAYVTAFDDETLTTVNVADPANITRISDIDDSDPGVTLDNPRAVFVVGTVAYVPGNDGSGDGNLTTFDVSNPASIMQSGTINDSGATEFDGANAVYVTGNKAYVTADGSDSLSIFDVTNPASITHLGFIMDGSGATQLNGANSVFVVGTKAYVTSGVDDSLSIFDISNPAAITELGTIVDDNMSGMATKLDGASSVYVVGNAAYVTSENDDSLTIFDVTNPANIIEVAVVSDGSTATRLNGAKSVFATSTQAFVASNVDDSLSIFTADTSCTVPTPTPTPAEEGIRTNVAAPVITSPVNGDTTGPLPVISGTAVRGTRVVVRENNALVGSVFSSSTDGAWTLTNFPAFTNGSHTITAVVDGVAETSGPSAPVTFTVTGGSDPVTATPTPESTPTATPSATDGGATGGITPTPTPEEPTPTPTVEEPTPTPTVEEPTPTPTDSPLDPDQLAPAIDVTGPSSLAIKSTGMTIGKLMIVGTNLDSMLKCDVAVTGNVTAKARPKKFPLSPKKPKTMIDLLVPNETAAALISSQTSETVTVTVTCGSLTDSLDVTLTPPAQP